MSREADVPVSSLESGWRLLVPALLLAMLAVVSVLICTPATAAAGDITLEWQNPLSGLYVSDEVELAVQASGNLSNILNVTFHYRADGDWTEIGEAEVNLTFMYKAEWDTETVPDGDYQLMANATLAEGGPVTVTVSNVHVDNTVPSLVFVSPRSGQRLNGDFSIVLSGDTDLASVDLFLDRGLPQGPVPLGSATRVGSTPNWTFEWDTSGISDDDSIGLIAAGRDQANNERRISMLNLHVDNVPPEGRLIAPRDNATMDGYCLLRGNTSEEFLKYVGFEWRTASGSWQTIGAAKWSESLGEWSLLWNTYEVGEHIGAEVRFVVEDDLGQRGFSRARNVTITDLPPEPLFTSPSEGAHLTGAVDIWIWCNNDTKTMTVEYWDGEGWVELEDVSRMDPYTWSVDWTTTNSLHETSLRAVAVDGSGPENAGTALLTGLEVDNTAPAPRIIIPEESDLHIFGTALLVATSDPDTTSLSFLYKSEDDWLPCGDAEYDLDDVRWELVWVIGDIFVEDSALRVVATDEVGLVGEWDLLNRIIGIEPHDTAPKFLASMPKSIALDEDGNLTLNLTDHVSDDNKSTLKTWVTGEPKWLFYVDGENITGSLDLVFLSLPNRHGEVVVRVYVEDPAGQRADSELRVTIRSVADAPYFWALPPNIFVHPDIPYTFNYRPYVEDPDNDKSELTILPPSDSHLKKDPLNPLGLVFTYGRSELDKVFQVTFVVRDPSMLTVNGSVTVRVTEDWVPELREPLPDVHMKEDVAILNAFSLDDYFHDPDHDTLYFSYGNKYVRVVIGNNYPHPVSLYPPKDWYGTDSVTFRATDPTGALLEDTIQIKCNSTNDAPQFRNSPAMPTLVIKVNSIYHFDLAPYVVDPDHELADLVLTVNNTFITRSTRYALGLRLLFPVKLDHRSQDLIITDPDGGWVKHELHFMVTDNSPPEMPPPRDVVMNEGETAAKVFNVTSAWDPDWQVTPGTWRDLNFIFVSSVAEFYLDPQTGWVDINLLNPDFNTYNESVNDPQMVLLRIMDSMGGLREYVFWLTVKPVDDAPQVDRIADIYLTEGIENIDLVNYVRDVDTPFSMLRFKVEDANDPDAILTHASVHGSLLALNYRGARTGTYVLNLWVMDANNRINTTVTVHVKAPTVEEEGLSIWMIVLLVVVTGVVAIYASKFVWGRFEPPSVSDVFLVYGDGVIIRHMAKRDSMSMDEDLAIAMLTAIQEFVQQSMRSAQLKSMQAGDNNILIERDPERLFYIAVIHTGTVSEELRKAINNATRRIKERFGDDLKKWDGNIARFDGVEAILTDILAISHAHIPEGVMFEMEGIKSIEPGKTFLFQSKDVTRTHNIFRGLVEEHGSGMLISRVHPQRLHPSIPQAGAECVWLSKTPTKRGVSPSNTTMILHEVTTFVRENPRTVVCMDGLEYLLVHNPLDEVIAFVSELTDLVQVDNFIMMIHVDPDALDDATLARLARDMVPVSERKLPNNNHR